MATKKSVKEFWRIFTQCTWEVFLNQNGKDEEKALTSMKAFAKKIIPENEHDILDQMPPARLKALIPKLMAHAPNGVELFAKHFEQNKPGDLAISNLLGQLKQF